MEDNSESTADKVGGEIPSTGKNSDKDKERFERAYKIFNSSIKRAENLLNINLDENKNALSIPEDKLLDSYRAVIVLSISALDAYIKTFVIVEIKQCLDNRNLPLKLKQNKNKKLLIGAKNKNPSKNTLFSITKNTPMLFAPFFSFHFAYLLEAKIPTQLKELLIPNLIIQNQLLQ